MWIFMFYDLPMSTPEERKEYRKFRKIILKDGFKMIQNSVYIRYCYSNEHVSTHLNRIKKVLPIEGNTILLTISDQRFEEMNNFIGKKRNKPLTTPEQIEMY